MPTKNNNGNGNPMDMAKLAVKIVQDSALTIFWESVDRLKKEVKVKVDMGLQYLLGTLAIITGLIFVLVGIADFLEELIGIKGIGLILTGVLVTVGGIWVGEKAKNIKQEK